MMTEILLEEGVDQAELSVSFVGRSMIRRLNSDYLNHDRVTDVISFNLSEGAGGALVGDIYICVLVARDQAVRFGVSPQEELFRLAAHGVYHLLGCDHEDESDRERMFALQERAVQRYFKSSWAGKFF
jgi:probable rRNA maturation factor